MSDEIFLNGLMLHAFHGCHAFEAEVGQVFGLDLALDIDLAAAAATDRLSATVSYDALVSAAREAFLARRYKLVEAAAGAVADALLAAFPAVRAVKVTVRKPNAPLAAVFAEVGVTLVRRRGG
jgi:dihydroneopterin aldolase